VDSGHIFTIVFGQATGIGLLLASSSRKRGGQKKVEELCQHIQGKGTGNKNKGVCARKGYQPRKSWGNAPGRRRR